MNELHKLRLPSSQLGGVGSRTSHLRSEFGVGARHSVTLKVDTQLGRFESKSSLLGLVHLGW